jgi:hypothetical protein
LFNIDKVYEVSKIVGRHTHVHTTRTEEKMTDKPLSQIESKLVADWLRNEKNVPVSSSYTFWRKRPATAAEFVRLEWNVKVTADDIMRAAGRDEI